MATTMSCPGCQTPLRLREDMAGKNIKCPRCGQVIAIPAGEIVTLEAVDDEDITPEPPALKTRNQTVATRSCPECGERIAWTARTCRYCHVSLDEDEDEEEGDDRVAQRSRYKPCPRCGEEGAKRVVWTPWGSFYGPALLSHVRCPECGYAYNGRSGRSNLIPAIIFVSVPLLGILAILVGLGWYIHHLGYF